MKKIRKRRKGRTETDWGKDEGRQKRGVKETKRAGYE